MKLRPCHHLLLFLSIFFGVSSFGQTPELINYQAVARNSQTGLELANTQIFLSCIVRSGGPNGPIVFQENHNQVSTDQFGLFSIQIGGGSPVTGSLGAINWAAGNYWLDTEVDAGDGLQSAGSLQLVTVPYAMHARTADIVDDADADPANELVESLSLSSTGTLTLSQNNGASNLSVDLSEFNSADNDPTNEFVTDFNFNEETRDLIIEQGSGPSLTTNIGGVNDADADPTNELVSNFAFNPGTRIITLGQNDGTTFSINIGGIDDADADPTNELLDGMDFTLDTRTLSLTQGDGSTLSTTIPFPDALWEFNEPESAVFNNTNRVGIGTDDPSARLSVQAASNTEPAIEVLSSGGETMIEAKDGSIGIGGENTSESDIYLGGSVSIKTRTVNALNGSDVSFNVLPDDYLVVVNHPFFSTGGEIDIVLPDPTDFPGRILVFRRIGSTGLNSATNFVFGSAELNGSPSGLQWSGFDPNASVTLISIGGDGWISY